MDLHLHISAGKDEKGNILADCHWGTETIHPHGFATCVTDAESLDILFSRIREMITDEVGLAQTTKEN